MPEPLSVPDFTQSPDAKSLNVINETFNTNLIYSPHRNDADARTVAEHVSESSLVLVEGYLETGPYAKARLGQHLKLASSRLSKPAYSESDSVDIKILADEFKDRLLQPETKADEFGRELYYRLLGNNCLILLADYMHVPTNADTLTTSTSPTIDMADAFRIVRQDNIDQLIERVVNGLVLLREHSAIREKSAVICAFAYLDQIAQIADKSLFSHTETGRLDVSIIYGLAHRTSLTKKFVNAGFNVTSTSIDSDPTRQIESFLDLETLSTLTLPQLRHTVAQELSRALDSSIGGVIYRI